MNHVNILDRLCGEIDNAATAVILTHNIDFLFVESLLLPRLRNIGYPRLTIFADASCAAGSFRQQHDLIERLGISYRVVPIDLGGVRRFHPKAFFLCSESKAALAVGSGNTTHGGWSANQEIWSDFSYPGGRGGSELAAFRDYLKTILTFVPDPEGILRDTVAAFSTEENVWTKDLPEPGGLAWTPNPIPMLTQITDFVGSEIHSIDVLSPYFDSDGAALAEISRITTGHVNALLQPRRLGLSKGVASKLPSNINLQSIEDADEGRRYKFIHAKAYVLHTSSDVVIAAGSANCSKAGLLADAKWGNAELMALSRASQESAGDLLSNFSISDVPPELHDGDPADDWKIEASDLRILAARRDGPHLEVHYKSAAPLTQLLFCSASDRETEANNFDEQRATFTIDGGISSIWLKGKSDDGLEIVSSPSWVDDETALRTAGPERRIRERLRDAAAKGNLSGAEFLQILELFDFHLQRPAAAGAFRKRDNLAEPSLPIEFTEADIYSNGFGKPPSLFNAAAPIGFSETDTLALFLSFFQTRQEGTRHFSSSTGSPGKEDGDENQEIESEIGDEEARRILGARILRVLKKIEIAIARPEFITSRPASRLSADIAFISLLMTKSRMDGYISVEQFRTQTLQIWKVLFFGPDGVSGIVPRYLDGLTDLERNTFASEMRSPKLSAAMALWGMKEWESPEVNLNNFRFAAASLAARFFWLSQGGTVDEINEELDRIAVKLLPVGLRESLFQVWANWVRDGQTLDRLNTALASKGQKELAELCVRPRLEEGELVWQTDRGICALATTCDRTRPRDKVDLIPMNQAARFKVLIAFVAPLKEILESSIGVSDRVKRHVWF